MKTFLWASIVSLGAAAILSALGRYWWVADLFSHLRFHYLAVAFIVLIAALLLRSWVVLIASIAVSLPHLWALFAYPTAAEAKVQVAGQQRHVRILSAALLYQYRHETALYAFIRQSAADVVCLQEAHAGWQRLLRDRLSDIYPHQRSGRHSREAILSRHPIESYTRIDPADTLRREVERDPGLRDLLEAYAGLPDELRFRYIRSTIRMPFGLVTVLCVHPPPPRNAALAIRHRGYMAALAIAARKGARPFLIVGDFNLTPYSPRFRALLRESGLRAVDHGKTWPQTWPGNAAHTWLVRYAPGIPIDHALVSREFLAISVRRVLSEYSDHRPVIVDLLLDPAAGR